MLGLFTPKNGESNGKEHGKSNGNWDYRVAHRGFMGVMLGLYWDNGKENGNYYLGFRAQWV